MPQNLKEKFSNWIEDGQERRRQQRAFDDIEAQHSRVLNGSAAEVYDLTRQVSALRSEVRELKRPGIIGSTLSKAAWSSFAVASLVTASVISDHINDEDKRVADLPYRISNWMSIHTPKTHEFFKLTSDTYSDCTEGAAYVSENDDGTMTLQNVPGRTALECGISGLAVSTSHIAGNDYAGANPSALTDDLSHSPNNPVPYDQSQPSDNPEVSDNPQLAEKIEQFDRDFIHALENDSFVQEHGFRTFLEPGDEIVLSMPDYGLEAKCTDGFNACLDDLKAQFEAMENTQDSVHSLEGGTSAQGFENPSQIDSSGAEMIEHEPFTYEPVLIDLTRDNATVIKGTFNGKRIDLGDGFTTEDCERDPGCEVIRVQPSSDAEGVHND